MSPWMEVLMSSSPVLVTRTFNANTSVVIPLGVTSLSVATGQGGAGTPATSGGSRTIEAVTYNTTFYQRDGGTYVSPGSTSPGHIDAAYCDDPFYYTLSESTVYSGGITCFYPATMTESTPPTSATTGAAATGFGLTFPGGTGGAATPTTYTNVAVVPGQSYPLTFPGGGSITINYYV